MVSAILVRICKCSPPAPAIPITRYALPPFKINTLWILQNNDTGCLDLLFRFANTVRNSYAITNIGCCYFFTLMHSGYIVRLHITGRGKQFTSTANRFFFWLASKA